MIDRHRPVVAGHVPVELVVIFEEARAVANRVIDLDGARGIDGIRNDKSSGREVRSRWTIRISACRHCRPLLR